MSTNEPIIVDLTNDDDNIFVHNDDSTPLNVMKPRTDVWEQTYKREIGEVIKQEAEILAKRDWTTPYQLYNHDVMGREKFAPGLRRFGINVPPALNFPAEFKSAEHVVQYCRKQFEKHFKFRMNLYQTDIYKLVNAKTCQLNLPESFCGSKKLMTMMYEEKRELHRSNSPNIKNWHEQMDKINKWFDINRFINIDQERVIKLAKYYQLDLLIPRMKILWNERMNVYRAKNYCHEVNVQAHQCLPSRTSAPSLMSLNPQAPTSNDEQAPTVALQGPSDTQSNVFNVLMRNIGKPIDSRSSLKPTATFTVTGFPMQDTPPVLNFNQPSAVLNNAEEQREKTLLHNQVTGLGTSKFVHDAVRDLSGRQILFVGDQPKLGPTNALEIQPTAVPDYIDAMDVVSVCTNRTHTRAIEPFLHSTSAALLRAIGKRWKFPIEFAQDSEATVQGLRSRAWCYIKGLPIITTIGVGRDLRPEEASAISMASSLASFAHMMIIPFEMIRMVQLIGEKMIDPVLYACRDRFRHFILLTMSSHCDKLSSCTWPEGVDSMTLQQWSWLIHRMREEGLVYWRAHRHISLPFLMHLPPELKTFTNAQSYFSFEVDNALHETNWDSMSPRSNDDCSHFVANNAPDTRYGLFQFETFMLSKAEPPNMTYPSLPVAQHEDLSPISDTTWFAMRDIVNVTSMCDVEARSFIDLLSKKWRRRIVYHHRIVLEQYNGVYRWVHYVSVQFEGIPYMFLGASAKHISAEECVRAVHRSINWQLVVLRLIPLELCLLRKHFNEEWDEAILCAAKNRFKALEHLIGKTVYGALHNRNIADTRPNDPLFTLCGRFVYSMRIGGRKFWHSRRVIEVPHNIFVPNVKFCTNFFSFKSVRISEEEWTTNVLVDDEVMVSDLEIASEQSKSVPTWEKVDGWKERRFAFDVVKGRGYDFSISDVLCTEYFAFAIDKYQTSYEFAHSDRRLRVLLNLVRFLASIAEVDLIVKHRETSTGFSCYGHFSGVLECVITSTRSARGRQEAFDDVLVDLYCFFLKIAVVVPYLEDFIADNTERFPYVVNFITKIASQTFETMRKGLEKKRDVQKMCDEILKDNMKVWGTEKMSVVQAACPNSQNDDPYQLFKMLPYQVMSIGDSVLFEQELKQSCRFKLARVFEMESKKRDAPREVEVEEPRQRRRSSEERRSQKDREMRELRKDRREVSDGRRREDSDRSRREDSDRSRREDSDRSRREDSNRSRREDSDRHRREDSAGHRLIDSERHRRDDSERHRREDSDRQRREVSDGNWREDSGVHRRADSDVRRRDDSEGHRREDSDTSYRSNGEVYRYKDTDSFELRLKEAQMREEFARSEARIRELELEKLRKLAEYEALQKEIAARSTSYDDNWRYN